MPIIFSTSSLALPGTLARFTGLSALKNAAVALNPGGNFLSFLIHCSIEAQTTLYLELSVVSSAFISFSYYGLFICSCGLNICTLRHLHCKIYMQ